MIVHSGVMELAGVFFIIFPLLFGSAIILIMVQIIKIDQDRPSTFFHYMSVQMCFFVVS
jgi:hypothetical protein